MAWIELKLEDLKLRGTDLKVYLYILMFSKSTDDDITSIGDYIDIESDAVIKSMAKVLNIPKSRVIESLERLIDMGYILP